MTTQQTSEKKILAAELAKISHYISLVHQWASAGCAVATLKECAEDLLDGMPAAYQDICVHILHESVMWSRRAQRKPWAAAGSSSTLTGIALYTQENSTIPPSGIRTDAYPDLSQDTTYDEFDKSPKERGKNDNNNGTRTRSRTPVKMEPHLSDQYPHKKASAPIQYTQRYHPILHTVTRGYLGQQGNLGQNTRCSSW